VKVNQKLKIICIIGILNFVIFSSSFSSIGKAVPDHEIGFTEGTELIWEIIELDLENFREIFGFNPNYELGDQIRMIIRDIGDSSGMWIIDVEFWDYKTDWGLSGDVFSIYVGKYPENYDDYLFSLTPVEDYLEQVLETLSSEYYRTGFDQIIIRSEGKFRIIPFGITFIGFTIVAIIATIVVSIKKKNLRIKI